MAGGKDIAPYPSPVPHDLQERQPEFAGGLEWHAGDPGPWAQRPRRDERGSRACGEAEPDPTGRLGAGRCVDPRSGRDP